MLKPVMPYIDYVLNYDYIQKELCENKEKPKMNCHGKCYLKKEIKKVEEKEQSPAMPNFKEVTEDYYVPADEITPRFNQEYEQMTALHTETPELLSGFASGLLDPPQA